MMEKTPKSTHKKIADDIRAPHQFNIIYFSSWQRAKFFILLLSDILALSNAWEFSRYLNNFYSPIPSALIWWVWFGLPSLFWIFAFIILFFLCL